MNAQSISLANGHAHTQTQGVRTPLSGGTRPLQSKPFHSSGLGISSINRAAGLLSSLLLELILAQWPERLPFYIWSMSNPQMARSGQKCHVWLSRFWSTEQMADLAALLRLERLKKEKRKKKRKDPSTAAFSLHPLSVDTNRALCYCQRNSWMWCLYNVSPCRFMTVSSCKLVDVNGIKQQFCSKVAFYKKLRTSVSFLQKLLLWKLVDVSGIKKQLLPKSVCCERLLMTRVQGQLPPHSVVFISLWRQQKCLRYTVPWFLDPTRTSSILKAKCCNALQHNTNSLRHFNESQCLMHVLCSDTLWLML